MAKYPRARFSPAKDEILAIAMNGLYDRLGLPEEMNERISQEIAQLIECSFE